MGRLEQFSIPAEKRRLRAKIHSIFGSGQNMKPMDIISLPTSFFPQSQLNAPAKRGNLCLGDPGRLRRMHLAVAPHPCHSLSKLYNSIKKSSFLIILLIQLAKKSVYLPPIL
jgi:hypothetical protein